MQHFDLLECYYVCSLSCSTTCTAHMLLWHPSCTNVASTLLANFTNLYNDYNAYSLPRLSRIPRKTLMLSHQHIAFVASLLSINMISQNALTGPGI